MNSINPDTDPAEGGDAPDMDALIARLTDAGEQFLEWLDLLMIKQFTPYAEAQDINPAKYDGGEKLT